MMAKPDFEATWYPRIGKNAAEELRRGRKIVTIGILSPLFAVAAGLLIGTGTVDDVLGFASATVVAVYVAMFIHAQVRIATALSEWYGVKVRGIPVMNPRRFDEFAEKRGLHRPDENAASGQAARSSAAGAGRSH
jgi:choline-glycine betaine transporter